MATPRTLGILAGGGPLPRQLADTARDQGRAVFIVAFPGQTDAVTVEGYPHIWTGLGAANTVLAALKEAAVQDVVMFGPMTRPSWRELKLDWRAVGALRHLMHKDPGDDSLLRAVVKELEGEGFRVVGAHEIFGGLLTPSGQLGQHAPDNDAWADIRRGWRVAKAIGALDVGQAVVVQQGLVLGVEAIEGTDALLARCIDLKRDGPGGVLVKCAKPGQEARADLPTCGLRTVEGAARAKLVGVALEAEVSLLLERERVIKAADRAGLFVYGLRTAEIPA